MSKTVPVRYYVFLAIFFAGALAFQLKICVATFRFFYEQGQDFHIAVLAPWTMLLILHVLTPLACLLLGFYVAAVRIWDPKAWLLLAVLVTSGVLSDGSDRHDEIMTWATPLRHTALVYRSLALFSWPFWMILFAIYFPDRADFDRRHPVWKWLILVPTATISVAGIAIRITFNEKSPLYNRLHPMEDPTHILRLIQIYGAVVFFLAVLLVKFLSAKNPDNRRRLKVLFFGFGVSLIPPVGIDAVARYLNIPEHDIPAWLLVPMLSMLALFPVTLAYVTVVQRALDVRVIIRQSLQYALARRGLVFVEIVLSLLVILAIASVSGALSFLERVLVTSIGIALIVCVGFGARRVAGWIDRKFFREAYNTEQVLNRLAESVTSIVELAQLLKTVTSRLAEALHISEIAVFLNEQNAYRPAFSLGYAQAPALTFPETAATVRELIRRKEPLPVYFDDPRSWLADLDPAEARLLNELGAQLLLPVVRRDLLGFMSLGSKYSEAPYSPTDLHLLQSVASQTALAVENSRLVSAIANETAAREVFQRELSIAREVQQRLFPQTYPQIPGVEFYGTCRPAREVGGDYYDFLELPQGGLGVAIGDVSGKGIPAALLMASLQAGLRGQTLSGSEKIDSLMGNINRLLCSSSSVNRYATFFYGHYEPEQRHLLYVNAGHNPPVVVRQKNGDFQFIRLEAGGLPVGLMPIAQYESSHIDLHCGDLVVLFTDGISEAMNAAGDEWGELRMLEAVKKANGAEPRELVRYLFSAADEFTGAAPQHDDMTLVVMRVS